jgi:hypothetical protein
VDENRKTVASGVLNWFMSGTSSFHSDFDGSTTTNVMHSITIRVNWKLINCPVIASPSSDFNKLKFLISEYESKQTIN